jgi:hypothetical protein
LLNLQNPRISTVQKSQYSPAFQFMHSRSIHAVAHASMTLKIPETTGIYDSSETMLQSASGYCVIVTNLNKNSKLVN